MADETTPHDAPDAQPDREPAAPAKPAKPPKAEAAPDVPAEPKPDPVMAKLVGYERELADLRKSLDAERARTKQFERDGRKAAVFAALADEFPGLPRQEIRGAALVAAEDGLVDLYAEDPAEAIARIKEMLRPKSKAAAKPTIAAPAASLGGTPGSPGKPPAQRKFLI